MSWNRITPAPFTVSLSKRFSDSNSHGVRTAEGELLVASAFVDMNIFSQHTIFPGVDILTTAGKEMMLSLVEFSPNAEVERHSHHHEQVGIVPEGRARLFVGDDDKGFSAG